jgi:hypothetical protein
VDFDDRAELLAEAPEVYYVTEHDAGYPFVLVRLSRVKPDVLRDLLGMAYKFVTAMLCPVRHRGSAESSDQQNEQESKFERVTACSK